MRNGSLLSVSLKYLKLQLERHFPQILTKICGLVLPYGIIDIGHHWLTHWGRVTHICVSKLTIIGSDNGLSPGRRQAIIWTNAGILLIRTLGTNFSEILKQNSFSFIPENAFENVVRDMASIWSRPQWVKIIACYLFGTSNQCWHVN